MERATASFDVEDTKNSRIVRSGLSCAILACIASGCGLLSMEEEEPPPFFSYRIEIPSYAYASPIPPVLIDGDITKEFLPVDAPYHRWALTYVTDRPLSERVAEVRVEFPSPCGTTTLLPGPEPARMEEELQRGEQAAYRPIDYDVYSAWKNEDFQSQPHVSFVTVDARDLEEVEVAIGHYVLPKVANEARVFQIPTPACAEPSKVTVNGEVVGTIDREDGSVGDIIIDAKGGRCYEHESKSYSTTPRVVFGHLGGPTIIRDQRVVRSGQRAPEQDQVAFPMCPDSIQSYGSTASCTQIRPVDCPRRILLTTDATVIPTMAGLANDASAVALAEILERRTQGLDPDANLLPSVVADAPSTTHGRVELSVCVNRRGKATIAVVRGLAAEVDELFRDTLGFWRFRPLSAKATPETRCTLVEYDVTLGPS
jgi:hypothetical protein